MSATGPDGEAPPAADGGESGHEYFETLERAFIRLRGAPLLLSPSDWQLAQEWHRRGIPVALVERVIAEVLEERRQREGADRIVSLRYFRRPVENAWQALGAVQASGARGEAEALDLPARLGALVERLPETLPEREALARGILDLEGEAEAIEGGLASLEEGWWARRESELAEEERIAIEATLEPTLARLRSRVSGAELQALALRLRREALRRRYGLPVLSLFSG